MAENKALVVYAAAYETVEAALADLDAIEQLRKDELIGQYDAAVIDKDGGEARIARRLDRPHIRVIPEVFGGGTLPRKELHEAAAELTAGSSSHSRPHLVASVGPARFAAEVGVMRVGPTDVFPVAAGCAPFG